MLCSENQQKLEIQPSHNFQDTKVEAVAASYFQLGGSFFTRLKYLAKR